jgi:hypothetical protein
LSTRWFTSNNTLALGFLDPIRNLLDYAQIVGPLNHSRGPYCAISPNLGAINISWAIFWRRFKCPRQFKFRQKCTYSPAARSGMDDSNLSGRDLNLMSTNIARYAQQLFVAFRAVSSPIVIRDFQLDFQLLICIQIIEHLNHKLQSRSKGTLNNALHRERFIFTSVRQNLRAPRSGNWRARRRRDGFRL